MSGADWISDFGPAAHFECGAGDRGLHSGERRKILPLSARHPADQVKRSRHPERSFVQNDALSWCGAGRSEKHALESKNKHAKGGFSANLQRQSQIRKESTMAIIPWRRGNQRWLAEREGEPFSYLRQQINRVFDDFLGRAVAGAWRNLERVCATGGRHCNQEGHESLRGNSRRRS